jgi:hypothetical protein
MRVQQAELEASMMERTQCLEQLQELQQSEREAVAEVCSLLALLVHT